MADTDQTVSDFAPLPDPEPVITSNTPLPPPEPMPRDYYVNPDKFIVLASRLGRQMVKLPPLDPHDKSETPKYHVPEAWERGEEVDRKDLYSGPAPGYADGVDRLIKLGWIGHLDHPEAMPAKQGLAYRREQERLALETKVAAGA